MRCRRGIVLLSTRVGATGRCGPCRVRLRSDLVGPGPFVSFVPDPASPVVMDDDLTGGMHVDFDHRVVSVWNASTGAADIEYPTHPIWLSFPLQRWYDRFE